jgi:hypothetical protein
VREEEDRQTALGAEGIFLERSGLAEFRFLSWSTADWERGLTWSSILLERFFL